MVISCRFYRPFQFPPPARFNSWDRQPFLTTVRTGKPDMIMQWREIHHNFFIDNYSPQENVDNDDGSAYYHTHDNFFVYGGTCRFRGLRLLMLPYGPCFSGVACVPYTPCPVGRLYSIGMG